MENVENVLNVRDRVRIELAKISWRGKLGLYAASINEQFVAEVGGEAPRKASHGGDSRREARDEDGGQLCREHRPCRRRMHNAESSEKE